MASRATSSSDRRRPARGAADARSDVLAALASPATYPGHPEVSVHETHASWVFVAGDRAYKVKKPVELGFLDYRTLAQRRACCREEVRVNQELAEGIYLGVRAVLAGEPGIRLAGEGAPGAIEYAVEMRRFREADTYAGLIAAGALTRAHVTAAARRIAAFHRAAPVVDEWGADRALALWQRNLLELQRVLHPAEWQPELLAGFGAAFVGAHGSEIERRARAGLARDGHGDLRCEHVLWGPTVRVVDRIEFDPALRRTDVACDLAFLTMDLEALGQRWAALALVSAYSEAGGDPGDEALLSFYAAHRAFVRAKVALLAGDQERAASLWSLGERLCWRARAPIAVVICGPAATGKSVLAGELARRTQVAVASSDAVRRRLAGVAAAERTRPEHYTPEFTRRTYRELGREAAAALRDDGAVIVDATCRSRAQRDLVLGPLRAAGLTPLVIRCEVPLELARERARRRLHDAARASDATPEIVAMQFADFEEPENGHEGSVVRLRTDAELAGQVGAVQRGADGLLAAGGHGVARASLPDRAAQGER